MTKTWSYSGENIASVHSSDASTVQRVYTVAPGQTGNALDRHDVNTSSETTTSRYCLYNHRGDVVGVTDSSGALKYLYEYDAYGNVTADYNGAGVSAPTDDTLTRCVKAEKKRRILLI